MHWQWFLHTSGQTVLIAVTHHHEVKDSIADYCEALVAVCQVAPIGERSWTCPECFFEVFNVAELVAEQLLDVRLRRCEFRAGRHN